MTLTEVIRAHPSFGDYCRAEGIPRFRLLSTIAADVQCSVEGPLIDARRVKQAIRDAAKNGRVKHGKGRPRKTYEVACAHCGRTNTISIVRE